MFTCQLIVECLVPPLTAVLMAKNTWIPLLASVVMLSLAGVLTAIIPETLPVSKLEENSLSEDGDKNSTWTDWFQKSRRSFSFAAHASVVAVLIAFMVSELADQSSALLLQYVSKRFEWSLSKVCCHAMSYCISPASRLF